MFFCHFSKVHRGISWSTIQENTRLQNSNHCQKIAYTEIAAVTLSESEFKTICRDISKPHPCYQQFAPLSLAKEDGTWQCISLIEPIANQKIILYTAGRKWPLYAAIEQ